MGDILIISDTCEDCGTYEPSDFNDMTNSCFDCSPSIRAIEYMLQWESLDDLDEARQKVQSARVAPELLEVLSEAIEYYAPCIIDDENQPHSHDEMIAKMEKAISKAKYSTHYGCTLGK